MKISVNSSNVRGGSPDAFQHLRSVLYCYLVGPCRLYATNSITLSHGHLRVLRALWVQSMNSCGSSVRGFSKKFGSFSLRKKSIIMSIPTWGWWCPIKGGYGSTWGCALPFLYSAKSSIRVLSVWWTLLISAARLTGSSSSPLACLVGLLQPLTRPRPLLLGGGEGTRSDSAWEASWTPALVKWVHVLGGISPKRINIEIRIWLNFKTRNNSGIT